MSAAELDGECFLSSCNVRQAQVVAGHHLSVSQETFTSLFYVHLNSLQVWWFFQMSRLLHSTNLTRSNIHNTSKTWSPSCKVSALIPNTQITEASCNEMNSTRLLPDLLALIHVMYVNRPPFICVAPFISGYNDMEQEKNEDCPQGVHFVQDDTKDMTKKVCSFKRNSLSFCSGLSDTNYGYSEGKPCVLLKMNRVNAHPHRFELSVHYRCTLLSFYSSDILPSLSANDLLFRTTNKMDTLVHF